MINAVLLAGGKLQTALQRPERSFIILIRKKAAGYRAAFSRYHHDHD